MPDLALHGGTPVLEEGKGRFDWPLITDGLRLAVERQLSATISIRDRSGVFREFEERFANYHCRQYSLLSNSGTSAIMSMFEGIEIGPGDEVISPAFGFHASVSPVVYLGGRVVFADIDEQGGLSVDSVMRALSARTKAVIVTHLWGLPSADIEQLTEICRRRGIYLFEDCSHAHGARKNGSVVGTAGAAAAWSLQGQKIVSGGEGGIMLTDDELIFERALLQGHYNRRTREEISSTNLLKTYFETGLGLKLRAHPLAIAIALEQFGHLDQYLSQKNEFALQLRAALDGFEFLRLPFVDKHIRPSWYAFPLHFNSLLANGVTRQEFVTALHAEGLCEVDVPSSTNVLADLPLFTTPQSVLGKRYPFRENIAINVEIPNARIYAREVFKVPIWARAEDTEIVDAYIEGFRKVSDHVVRHGRL